MTEDEGVFFEVKLEVTGSVSLLDGGRNDSALKISLLRGELKLVASQAGWG